jgi:hypothetical protein
MALFRNGDGLAKLRKLINDAVGTSENLGDKLAACEECRDRQIAERRRVLTSTGTTDPVALSKLDTEISKLEQELTGIADAHRVTLEHLADLREQERMLQDQQLREGRAQEIEAHAANVAKTLAAAEKPVDALVAALRVGGSVAPESAAAGQLLASAITEVRTAAPYLKTIFGDAVRRALTPPPKKVAAQPAPPQPQPDGLPAYYKGPRGGMPSVATVPEIPAQTSGVHDPRAPRWGGR